jgi:DNA-binding transcriptional LysR family regulator
MDGASPSGSFRSSYDLYSVSLDQLSTLDPRRLLVLDAVVRHGSFAAAASALSLTPSAVSQQIAALERECGATLIERNRRVIRFTDAGEQLSRRAATLRELLDAANDDLASLRSNDRGVLSVGIFESAARRLLPAALKRFAVRYPDVEVAVHEVEPGSAFDDLRRGELDLAVTHSYSLAPREIPKDLLPTEIGEDPLLLVRPRTTRRPRRLADLAGERWIGPTTDDCRQTLLLACRTAGFEPRIESTVSDYRLAEQLAASGFGVALAPSFTLADRPVAGTVRHRLPEIGVRRITAWRTSTNCRSKRIDALVGELQQRASDAA